MSVKGNRNTTFAGQNWNAPLQTICFNRGENHLRVAQINTKCPLYLIIEGHFQVSGAVQFP